MQRIEENALHAEERGSRFKLARAHLGQSQAKMAKMIGCTVTTWQNYEGGATMPGGAQLEAMARLGFSANWLLTGDGSMLTADERAAPAPAPAAPADAAVPLDEDLLGRVFEGIKGVYKEQGGRISDRDAGILAARFYADLVASCDDPDERRGGLKAMLQQLRRDIRATTATDQGKRLA